MGRTTHQPIELKMIEIHHIQPFQVVVPHCGCIHTCITYLLQCLNCINNLNIFSFTQIAPYDNFESETIMPKPHDHARIFL